MEFQQAPDDLPGIIDAFRKLLEALIAHYGTWGTLVTHLTRYERKGVDFPA